MFDEEDDFDKFEREMLHFAGEANYLDGLLNRLEKRIKKTFNKSIEIESGEKAKTIIDAEEDAIILFFSFPEKLNDIAEHTCLQPIIYFLEQHNTAAAHNKNAPNVMFPEYPEVSYDSEENIVKINIPYVFVDCESLIKDLWLEYNEY